MADRAQNMDGHYAIPKKDLDRLRAAADLLARVRGNCTIQIVGSGNPTTAVVTGPPDLLRELAEALKPN